MKKLFFVLPTLFLIICCTLENTEPPFEVQLQLTENTGQFPPLLAIVMGGGFVFKTEFPGEPQEAPTSLVNGDVMHGIIDIYQYVSQGYAAGFIDTAIFRRNSAMIDTVTITDEWVDVIFTVAVGEDEEGKPMVFVEGKNGKFLPEPFYFELTTVEFQDNVFEVMEAVIPAGFEYYNGTDIVWFEGQASLMYLADSPPAGSLQLFFEKIPMGMWTVNDQTFDVALAKESAPPYRKELYTNFYIDVDGNGTFDITPGGMEAYPITEPFYIAGESWEISEVKMDGSSITIVESEEEVDPKVALRPGTEAPNFTAETLDGEELSLSDLSGKYVMIDFWGTWCAPCIEALPVIKEAYEKYSGENFEIVGIANEPSLERFEDFVEREGLEWPQIPEIYEENNEIQELYSVNSYPTYYLIGPDGEIVEYGMALSADNLMGTLAKYLE